MNQKKVGILLSYISQIIKILTTLIYTPIMLRLLGQSEYGLYQLVYSVVTYLSLLSLGFGSSYMRFYSKYKTKNDIDGISRLNGMFMIIFGFMSVICIICGLIMLDNIRMIFGSGLTDIEYEIAHILMKLMIFNMALTFPNSVFECWIIAHEEFFFQKMLIIFKNILNPFLTIPLLIMKKGSIGMVGVSTFLTIMVLVLNMLFCFKKLHMKFIFTGFKSSLLKEMWIFTFFIFINQIIDQINWNVDKFLLGRFAGTTAVAVYGVGSQINTLYMQLSTAVSSVFVPKVNQIVAEAKENMNRELTVLFTRIGRIQFIILMLILTGVMFFGEAFIYYWAGDGYEQAYIIALLLIMPVTIPLIQNLGIEIQRAKNMHKARAVVYLCIAIVNIFISTFLIKLWGASGAALGTAISVFIGNGLFMNWYYQKKIGLDMIYFWKNILHILLALILPCSVGWFMIRIGTFNNIADWCACIILYVVVYCISMWLWGMNQDEKLMIVSVISKMTISKRK